MKTHNSFKMLLATAALGLTLTATMPVAHAGKNATAKAYAANKLPGILGQTAMIYEAGRIVGAPGLDLRPAPVKAAASAAAMEHEEMMKLKR